jgi:catechol 2,3-dioxygenase-like lactoylglutathione lyase family enzyme
VNCFDEETTMTAVATQGIHHLGLTVSRLEASAAFFVDTLGWQEVRRDPDYPAIFVSDGMVMVSLWQATDADSARPFDQRHQVGLHHVAFRVATREALDAIHQRLQTAAGVEMEFSPELLRQGPAWHLMCYEPSGVRVEFIWWPEEGA